MSSPLSTPSGTRNEDGGQHAGNEQWAPRLSDAEVQRSIAVRRADGSVALWGVERKKDTFTVFPMS